jgi:hypothetical protein
MVSLLIVDSGKMLAVGKSRVVLRLRAAPFRGRPWLIQDDPFSVFSQASAVW